MPQIKGKQTSLVTIRMNKVVDIILENPKYFQSKRNKELNDRVSQEFNVNARQARKYISGAIEYISEMINERKIKSLENAIIDREFLLIKAKENSDYKLALEVAKDRDKILGLYEEKINHTGEVAITFVEKLDE